MPPLCKGRWVCVSKAGGVGGIAKRGHANIFISAVNPSVSLAADSSPYTGEPGQTSRQEIRLFLRA